MRPPALTLISLPLNALLTITVSVADEWEMPKMRGRARDRTSALRESNLQNLHEVRLSTLVHKYVSGFMKICTKEVKENRPQS